MSSGNWGGTMMASLRGVWRSMRARRAVRDSRERFSIGAPGGTTWRRACCVAFGVVVLCMISDSAGAAPPKGAGRLTAIIHTTAGDLRCELFPDKAPHTVANFVG